ncbi:hypothetical protein J6590_047408 [Homalodisca vitripennis]|nr:hypothetical protein J6590_047408 [Homalodisca vitripennis]
MQASGTSHECEKHNHTSHQHRDSGILQFLLDDGVECARNDAEQPELETTIANDDRMHAPADCRIGILYREEFGEIKKFSLLNNVNDNVPIQTILGSHKESEGNDFSKGQGCLKENTHSPDYGVFY